MKKLLLVLPFVLALSAEASTQLFICEGKIGNQDITLVDDEDQAYLYKGKLNIAAGARGNNFPVITFASQELNFVETSEGCKLTGTSAENGSFTVSNDCSGNGTGTITALSLPSIGLTAETVQVTCRLEHLNQTERRQPEPREQTSQPQRQCYGSIYAPECFDDEEESR